MLVGRMLAGLALAGSIGVGFTTQLSGGEPKARRAAPMRIGMIDTLFTDVPQSMVLALQQPFNAVMEAETGVSGELMPGGDLANLSQQIVDHKMELGIFHGIEFAWARERHPELHALAIAVNHHTYLHAILVVKADSKTSGIKDLQNNTLALARSSREHCMLYLDRHCRECSLVLSSFFSRMTTTGSEEEAIDDVVDGVVDGAVVDGLALDCYKRRKPGRYVKVKPAHISEPFPADVVVYKNGAIDEATLKKLREGLKNANRTVLGRQIMTLFKLSGFEPVPKDYDQALVHIAKDYPEPAQGGVLPLQPAKPADSRERESGCCLRREREPSLQNRSKSHRRPEVIHAEAPKERDLRSLCRERGRRAMEQRPATPT
jgi:ABC-type phosphate/phosphonate transport system substrate-binding protein